MLFPKSSLNERQLVPFFQERLIFAFSSFFFVACRRPSIFPLQRCLRRRAQPALPPIRLRFPKWWTFLTKFERISRVAAANRTQPPHYLKARPSVSQKVGSNRQNQNDFVSKKNAKIIKVHYLKIQTFFHLRHRVFSFFERKGRNVRIRKSFNSFWASITAFDGSIRVSPGVGV